MKKFLFTLIMLLSCLCGPARASQDEALQALETLRRGFAGMTDFTADIVQEKQLSMMKRKLVSKGLVRFRKPGSFYMEIHPPHASRLLLRDNVLTMRLPEQGTTDRIVLPPEESLEKWFAYLAKPLTALPEGMEVRAERQGGNWHLQFFPRSKGGIRELSIHFDPDGKISRLAIEEKNRDRTVIRFTNIRRNAGLKEKDFVLE